MTELFVYICAIFILLYLAFVALQALKTYNPTLYEGLENAAKSGASATSPSTQTMPVTGLGSASQLYGQTVTTAISALETELGMDAYADQYLTILADLKTLYTQRALKLALQTSTQSDNVNMNNQFPLYLYGQNIQTLEMLEDFVRGDKKPSSSW
jgi:hypothetical protein